MEHHRSCSIMTMVGDCIIYVIMLLLLMAYLYI